MPHFVILGNFTQKRMETIKALPENLKEAKEVFKSHGVKINTLVFTMGRYDVVGICEAPDAETAEKMFSELESVAQIDRILGMPCDICERTKALQKELVKP